MSTCRKLPSQSGGCALKTEQTSSWHFCTHCGCTAGEIDLLGLDPEAQAAESSELRLTALRDKENHAQLLLTRTGRQDVRCTVRSLDPLTRVDGVEWQDSRGIVKLNLAAAPTGHESLLELVTWDGPRKDRWSAGHLLEEEDPNASIRKRRIWVKVQDRFAKLEAAPTLLVFHPNRTSHTVRLVNLGTADQRVDAVLIPTGFRLSRPDLVGSFTVPPGLENAVSIEVFSDGGTHVGDLQFRSSSAELARVKCVSLPPPPTKALPARVVAIDFGTSNTSVFVCDPKTQTFSAVKLDESGQARIPTVVKVDQDKMAWRALEATGETDTMVVRGLKTQVRKPETTLTVEGYQFSIHELLTFYLRTLLEKKLAARLDQAVTAGDWVEFVFTVPVLDGEGGEDRTRYEERLRAAAIAAGFQDADRNWTISLLPEPDGGLHDVLLNPRTKSAFGNGDRVLVVDIGGGTTDLTLALIGIEGDRPTVREHLNAAASTMRENSAVQVGGNEITFLLGREWFKAERGAAERATGEQAKNRQDLLQRVLTNFGRGEGALLGTHLKFFDNVAASEEPQHSDLNCWFFRYPKLFSILEAHKKDFATKPVQALPVTGEDMESQVTYPQFLKASTDLLQAVVQGVQGLLDRANIKPEDVRHVVPIGGTSKLPQLREALRTLFSDRVIRYEPDLVDTAVCRGAALSRSAVVTPFPFGLVLRRPDGRHTQVVEAGAVLSEPAVKSSGTVEVPKGRHEKVQLLATFGDQQYLLRDFLCTDGSHSVSVRVDASRIAATHVVAGSPVDEFEYPL